MSFEEMARRAADDVRSRAESGPSVGAAMYRRRRARRSAVTSAALAAMVVVGVFVGSSLLGEGDEIAIDTTLPPEVTTTLESSTTVATTTPPNEIPASGVLGAGWEELYAGPVAGRYRMTAAWTGDQLFVFGGHVGYRQESPDLSAYEQDAYLFDPTTETWWALEVPAELCDLGQPRALWLDDLVFLHGEWRPGDCSPFGVYDPSTDAWGVSFPELARAAAPTSPAAWTGELLVFPTLGAAWDPDTGEEHEIPMLSVLRTGFSSPMVAHWTGSHVAAIGPGSLYLWEPGSDSWIDAGEPPIHVIARDSAIVDGGLLLANYDMAAAWWTAADGWVRKGDLPLRFYECLANVVSAGGTPVVQMCSGLAIWDQAGGFWVPVPLEDVTGWVGGLLVGADDTLYSLGPRLRRFEIERDSRGRIIPPSTIPIGVMQLDLPAGFEVGGSFAPDHGAADRTISDDETHGVILDSVDGRFRCSVESTYLGNAARFDGYADLGEIAVHRPGRPMLEGRAYRGGEAVLLFSFDDANGSDRVVVECGGQDGESLSDLVSTIAQGLWSPWGDPTAEDQPYAVVTPRVVRAGDRVTIHAYGWPVGWKVLTLVTTSGTQVATLRSDHFPHDNPDFSYTFAVDEPVDSLPANEIPEGSYMLAVDGRIVPGTEITKARWPHARVEISYVFETGDDADPIGTVEVENVGRAEVDLAGWSLADEISPTSRFTFGAGTVLQPGERVFVEYQRTNCPSPTGADFVVCVDPPRQGSLWDSISLRTPDDQIVDRRLLAADCPWVLQTPNCGFVLVHDSDAGLRYQVPADRTNPPDVIRWYIADEPLVAGQNHLEEVVALATFRMRPGGDSCADVPENAIDDLGEMDALVWVARVLDPEATAPPRPTTFDYLGLAAEPSLGVIDCLDRLDRFGFYVRTTRFADRGAVYQITIALGNGAYDIVREQVLGILNGLDFNPR